MRFWALAAVVGGWLPSLLAAQAWAGDADQRAIELVVARHLAPGLSRDKPPALDPRLYRVQGSRDLMGRGPRDGPAISAARTDQHLSEIAKILATSVIPDANGACLGSVPQPCRFGSSGELLTFSPGFVQGNFARIEVCHWIRSATAVRMMKGAYVHLSGWEFRLEKKGSSWEITGVIGWIV
jgi:hypothetical protein